MRFLYLAQSNGESSVESLGNNIETSGVQIETRKMGALKLQEWTSTEDVAGMDIVGVDNEEVARVDFAGVDNDRGKA